MPFPPSPPPSPACGRGSSEEFSPADVTGVDVWPTVLRRLQEEKPGLAHELKTSRLIPAPGPQWRLVFQRPFDMERAKNNHKLLEAQLSAVVGRAVHLAFEVGAASPAPAPAVQAEWQDAREPGAASEDPSVRKVLEILPGKVKHVKKKA